MQTLKATELFGNISKINNGEFESTSNINIDFSGVDAVDLRTLQRLSEIQKLALLNNKTLSLSNLNPDVQNILDITGVNKTFANLATNPIISRSK